MLCSWNSEIIRICTFSLKEASSRKFSLYYNLLYIIFAIFIILCYFLQHEIVIKLDILILNTCTSRTKCTTFKRFFNGINNFDILIIDNGGFPVRYSITRNFSFVKLILAYSDKQFCLKYFGQYYYYLYRWNLLSEVILA